MPVFRLDPHDLAFPPPHLAEPNGLLAIGGDLDPQRLVLAYQNGIFPWFESDGNFFWYAPDPRCVLFPKDLKIHKSMRNTLNQQQFSVSFDRCFPVVMEACSEIRRDGQDGTWISEPFIDNYSMLHYAGIAHSVEVWEENELVGGLYGLSMGKIFYGESMFARRSNASKIGFITLVQALAQAGFWLVDCQQRTGHLVSLGATTISRDLFMEYLSKNLYEKTQLGQWTLHNDLSFSITPIDAITADVA